MVCRQSVVLLVCRCRQAYQGCHLRANPAVPRLWGNEPDALLWRDHPGQDLHVVVHSAGHGRHVSSVENLQQYLSGDPGRLVRHQCPHQYLSLLTGAHSIYLLQQSAPSRLPMSGPGQNHSHVLHHPRYYGFHLILRSNLYHPESADVTRSQNQACSSLYPRRSLCHRQHHESDSGGGCGQLRFHLAGDPSRLLDADRYHLQRDRGQLTGLERHL